MIKKGQPSIRAALFGGHGEVRVWNLLTGLPHPPKPFTAVLACELDPRGHVGRHSQEHFPELVIGLEGEGEASVNGHRQALTPGEVVHLPLGAVLELRNLSAEVPLRYLIIKARG